MSAFVLILIGLVSRMGVLSTHWFNFTAVGGSLLFFASTWNSRERFCKIHHSGSNR